MNKILGTNLLWGFSLLSLVLLFLPKINLLSVENETAGLRIDDIVLVTFFFAFGCASIYNNKSLNKIELLLLGIVTIGLVSFLINGLLVAEGILHNKSKIFYVVRIAEYFLFFYAGRMLFQILNLDSIIKAFLLFNIVFMLLQKFGVIGTIRGFNLQAIDTSRLSGIASFPSEMGGLLNMIFCYLLLNEPKHGNSKIVIPSHLATLWNKTRRFCLFILFMCLTALTGSRIAVSSTLFIYLLFLFYARKKNTPKFLLSLTAFLLLILPLVYVIVVNTEQIYTRSAGLLSTKNFSLITNLWDSVDINNELRVYNPDYYQENNENYDMSWWERIHKWTYALKNYLNHPECYLQGIGPGAFSAAVDGGFLRILTETGLVGSALYFLFFKSIYKLSETLKWIMIGFLLNMIFFDIYLAYKTMSFLFLVTGYYFASKSFKLENQLKYSTKIQWST